MKILLLVFSLIKKLAVLFIESSSVMLFVIVSFETLIVNLLNGSAYDLLI